MVYLFFAAAVILSLALTPAAARLCILDKPNHRKIHEKPIPKAGGIGIFIPVVLVEAAAFLLFRAGIALDTKKYLTIIFVTFFLMVMGILDDKLELRAKTKLWIQAAAAIFTLSSGIRFHTFGIEVLDLLATTAWIICIVNAVNLIDGLDGLAAGIAVISCAGFFVIGYTCGYDTIMFLTLIIMGACLGFLKYNFRPARIFMGDAGSVPLGYNLAVAGILCENAISGRTSVIIPVVMLGVPIFDTVLTVARRYLHHKPIFQPDRSHFYNLLADMKEIGHKNTVLLIYGINAVLVMLSSMLAFLNGKWRIISICMLIAVACMTIKAMGFLKKGKDTYPLDTRPKV